MLVDDQRGVCIWDGRPEHEYAKVRWSDGSESGILPICRIRTEEAHFYEEVTGPENDGWVWWVGMVDGCWFRTFLERVMK